MSTAVGPPRCYFVTGANGFLGIHLLRQITRTSGTDRVRVYSRQKQQPLWKLFREQEIDLSRLEYTHGTLDLVEDLAEGMKGCHGIFHLAGLVVHSRSPDLPDYPEVLYRTNVEYSENIIRAAGQAGVKRVVMASTSGVVGCRKRSAWNLWKSEGQGELPNDDSPYCEEIAQQWPYYHSKILAEKRTLALGIQQKVEVIWMRPSMLIGPGDVNFRSIRVIFSFLSQTTPIIPNGTISVVDVRDVAASFLAAMERGQAFTGYSLSSLNCSLRDFYGLLSQISGVPTPLLRFIPDRLIIKGANCLQLYDRWTKDQWNDMHDPVRAEMSSHDWSVSPIRAERELDFRPRDPVQSLQDTVQWIRENEFLIASL